MSQAFVREGAGMPQVHASLEAAQKGAAGLSSGWRAWFG